MARPIEYDKEAVLNNAMQLFWKKGYEATSMKELVDVTGLTTRSMYNIFGSKNGLFEACLDWYYHSGIRSRYENLIREDGLIAIRHFFDMLAERKTKEGCFYVNTASNRSTIEDGTITIVDEFFENLESIFEAKLFYAVEKEGYEDDPVLRAKQLIVIVQGLSVYSKVNSDPTENRKMIYNLLASLNI
jgi:TetR/AcrR family transcriptional repressor of nem operon